MKFLRLGIFLFVLGLVSVVFAGQAKAATFTVDNTADSSAADPNVSCDIGDGSCTLRSSIEAANAQAGADTIAFNIAGAGVQTISPASAFPTISEQLTIDGSTQTGASCGTLVPSSLPATNTPHTLLIEIDGTNASPGTGVINIAAGGDNSTVKGLIIGNATNSSSAIYLSGSITGGTVECNYLGTNAAGTAAAPNQGAGVTVDTATGIIIQNNLISGNSSNGVNGSSSNSIDIHNNLVGTNAAGTAAIANAQGVYINGSDPVSVSNNVISGNTGFGVRASGSNNVTITGNFAGLGVTGSPLGNGGDGISTFGSSSLTIGGTSSALRNVSSANGGAGLHIYSNCDYGGSNSSTTYGNYFGTTSSGAVQSGYGNTGAGVEVNEYYGGCVSVYQHKIGGDDAGQPNIIAGNTAQGILIHQSSDHDVFSISAINNSIYGNGQFGIDLALDTDNNSGVADADLGPNPLNSFPIMYPTGGNANNYLNRPEISSTSYSGNQLTVNYSFQAPGVTDNAPYILASNLVGFRLDFYLNEAGQDGAYNGYSQGKTHIGSFIVDGSESNASHVFTSPVPLSDGQTITSTTTALWQKLSCPNSSDQSGDGPPYQSCTPPPP